MVGILTTGLGRLTGDDFGRLLAGELYLGASWVGDLSLLGFRVLALDGDWEFAPSPSLPYSPTFTPTVVALRGSDTSYPFPR